VTARRLAAALLAGALALAAPAGAAPSARWQVSPPAPVVGDVITARLALDLPPGAEAEWAGVAPDFGGLAVAGVAPLAAPGGGEAGRVYTLHADLPGAYRLPAVTVPYAGPGGAAGRVEAAAVSVTVAGAFDPEGPPPPPAPARGPVALPLPWPVYALGGAAAALAGGAALWLWRRRRPLPAQAPPAPPPAPDRAALARLDALDPDALPPRVFYGALSEIARGYLEDRFGVPARARTTSETAAGLKGHGDGVGAPVAEWLAGWDLVKFARLDPPPADARGALEAVRGWVRRTAPGVPDPGEAEERGA